MVCINNDYNGKIMCDLKQLNEDSQPITTIRKDEEKQMNLSDAIDKAIMEMPDDFTIKEEIIKHQEEVKDMLFSELNYEYEMNKLWDQIRSESYEEGLEKANKSIKAILLEDGFSEEKVNLLIEKLLLKEQAEEQNNYSAKGKQKRCPFFDR